MKYRMTIPTLLIAGAALAAASAASAQSGNDQVTRFTAADGTQVTVTSGQPPAKSYGPRPSFEQLDTNRDGTITRDEAEAYIPLLNDFDNLAHHVPGISRRAYARWDQR
jgi:hypothetical protein